MPLFLYRCVFIRFQFLFRMFWNVLLYFPLFIRNSMSFHIIHRPLVDFKDKQATGFSGCMTLGWNINEPTEGSLSSLHRPSNMVLGNAWWMIFQYISATWKNVNKVKKTCWNRHKHNIFGGEEEALSSHSWGSLYLDQFGWLDNRHRPVTSWYSRLWSGWWHRDLCPANFSGGNSSWGLRGGPRSPSWKMGWNKSYK